MGASCTRERDAPQVRWAPRVPVPVTLHIYNLGTSNKTQAVNNLLRKIGTGAFHCGVEVYGCEWSYSDITRAPGEKVEGTGLFCSTPRHCEGHSYCESIPMGKTSMSEGEIMALLSLLKMEWPVDAYSTLRKNCCHFCEEFCQRLGVGSIPGWVKNLAGAGAAIVSAGDTVCCHALASQAASNTVFCCGSEEAKGGPEVSEVVHVDIVDALPVLPPFRNGGAPRVNSVDSYEKEALN